MKPVISNRVQLDKWLDERRRMGRDVVSQKGSPPDGSTFSDGSPMSSINIAWQDTATKEIFAIEYELVNN